MGLWGIPVVVGVVVVADRVTKELAVRRLAPCGGGEGVLRLVINHRLPLAGGDSSRRLIGLWLAAVACAVGLLALLPAGPAGTLVGIGVAAAITGASSNLGDRLAHGSVVDFIAIGWWPAFNLADVAIVGGGAVAALALV
jgi:signal peptidase II